MRTLTRTQIIKEWKKQSFDNLNSFCCPDCRDILTNYTGTLICGNSACLNSQQFDPKTGEEVSPTTLSESELEEILSDPAVISSVAEKILVKEFRL